MENSAGIIQIILIIVGIFLGVWIIRRFWLWLLMGVILFFFVFHGSCLGATYFTGATG